MWGLSQPGSDPRYHSHTGNLGQTALSLKKELQAQGYEISLCVIQPDENRAQGVGMDWFGELI